MAFGWDSVNRGFASVIRRSLQSRTRFCAPHDPIWAFYKNAIISGMFFFLKKKVYLDPQFFHLKNFNQDLCESNKLFFKFIPFWRVKFYPKSDLLIFFNSGLKTIEFQNFQDAFRRTRCTTSWWRCCFKSTSSTSKTWSCRLHCFRTVR